MKTANSNNSTPAATPKNGLISGAVGALSKGSGAGIPNGAIKPATASPGTTAADNRERLLNMAAGGSGHTSEWLERVTLDDAPEDKRTAYMYHRPRMLYENGKRSGAAEFLGCEEHARKFYALGHDEITDIYAIPVEDNGRHIPADVWQKCYETYLADN